MLSANEYTYSGCLENNFNKGLSNFQECETVFLFPILGMVLRCVHWDAFFRILQLPVSGPASDPLCSEDCSVLTYLLPSRWILMYFFKIVFLYCE